MTRKDYICIASELRVSALCSPIQPPEWRQGFAEAVAAVADALESDNPRFNRDRFFDFITLGL